MKTMKKYIAISAITIGLGNNVYGAAAGATGSDRIVRDGYHITACGQAAESGAGHQHGVNVSVSQSVTHLGNDVKTALEDTEEKMHRMAARTEVVHTEADNALQAMAADLLFRSNAGDAALRTENDGLRALVMQQAGLLTEQEALIATLRGELDAEKASSAVQIAELNRKIAELYDLFHNQIRRAPTPLRSATPLRAVAESPSAGAGGTAGK